MAQIRLLCVGEGEPDDVVPLIDATHSSIHQTWQKFLIESTEDAEMSLAAREKIAQALEDYLDSLLKMRDATGEREFELLSTLVEQSEANVEAIRAAQNEHKASLLTGPTLFPFLNRLLIQHRTVRAGANTMRLAALLNEGPSFLRSLRTELDRRAISPVKVQVVFHLQQALEKLQTALESEVELPDIEEEISEFASQLAGMLAEAPLESSMRGATPLSGVNQVLQALGALTGSKEDLDFFLSLMDQCRNQLRSLLPVSSPADHLEKLNLVLDDLDNLQECVLEEAGYDDMVNATNDLESSANELSAVLPGSEDTGDRYSEFIGHLPPLFKSILIPAYAFLEGQASADDVFAASEHLESSTSELMRETEELPQDDKAIIIMRDALETMREAADMLRDFAESANPQLLEIATSLCHQASDQLKQANVG